MTAAAVAAVCLGVWLAARDPSASRLPRPVRRRVDRGSPLDHPHAAVGAAALVGGAAVVPVGPVAAVGLGLLAWAGMRELGAHRRDAAERRHRVAWTAGLRGAAAALAAGLAVADALERGGCSAAAIDHGAPAADADAPSRVLPVAAAVARVGGDPVDDLRRRVARGPGSRLVTALVLARSTGAAPAGLVDELARAAAAGERADQEADTALAGAQATARLLAALPIAGVALAAAFGASAPTFLLATAPGRGCFLVAAVLEVAGLRWSARIVRSARR